MVLKDQLIYFYYVTEKRIQTWSGPHWRRSCGCGSSGRRLANTPWRSTHGHWSGSSRRGWPGRDVERRWSSRRFSSHSWGCRIRKQLLGRLLALGLTLTSLDSVYTFAGHVNTHLSTSSRVTMSFFFKALMAYSFPVFLNSASNTCTETPTSNWMRKPTRSYQSRWAPGSHYLPEVSSAQNWDVLVIIHLHPWKMETTTRRQRWEQVFILPQ